jgi:adenylate kinase
MKKIVFLGSAGVGKGTYAQDVSAHYNIPTISTGQLLREQVKAKTDVGNEAIVYMDKGELVPTDIITKILKKRLLKSDSKKGFILDGYPRSMEQTEALAKIIDIDVAVNFTAPTDVILARLGGRRTCANCGRIFHIKNVPPKKEGICDICGSKLIIRKDDQPEAIKKRLDIYKKEVTPVLNYYKQKGILKHVDATVDYSIGGAKIIADTIKAIEE